MATINFKEKVLDRSFEIPVVVDFWAAWCNPCRVLGPVITEMSEEANGAWELVKVDTEANQEIAKEYNIYSIPNVKMFYQGEAIAEFSGALPKHQINSWLNEHLPNPAKDNLHDLLKKVRSAPSTENLLTLETFTKNNPAIFEAELYHNWFRAVRHPEAINQWAAQQSSNPSYQGELQDVKALAELALTQAEGSEGFVDAYKKGVNALKELNIEEGMSQLVKTVMFNKGFHNELPRRAMISLFHLMGEGHALTKKYRPHFSMALY